MEHITVLSIEQIHELRARYQRAKPVVMLDPEPPFDSRKLIEVDPGKMLQQGSQPSEYARQMMVVHDRDEAERVAQVDGDVAMLCELALALYARVAALPPP